MLISYKFNFTNSIKFAQINPYEKTYKTHILSQSVSRERRTSPQYRE